MAMEFHQRTPHSGGLGHQFDRITNQTEIMTFLQEVFVEIVAFVIIRAELDIGVGCVYDEVGMMVCHRVYDEVGMMVCHRVYYEVGMMVCHRVYDEVGMMVCHRVYDEVGMMVCMMRLV